MQGSVNIVHLLIDSLNENKKVILYNEKISICVDDLRGIDTLSGETALTKCFFYLPSEMGSTLKGKNLLPLGANSFLVEESPFQKGFVVQTNKQEVSKIVSLVKKG